jgi:flavin-dependent dehydrogenase
MGLKDWLDAKNFHTPTGLRIGAPNGEIAAIETTPNSPTRFGKIIPRQVLDAKLVETAVQAGANFLPGTRATGMEVEKGKANVSFVKSGDNSRNQSLSCQMVIAADGSLGSFSRSITSRSQGPVGIAARVYMIGEDHFERFFDWLYEPDVLPGYGWVFPEGNGVVNVGIGTPIGQSNPAKLLERLQKFVVESPYVHERVHQLEAVGRPRAAPLDWSFDIKQSYNDHFLAVGDAAGLVSPLTGSGISKALISGEIATEHTIKALKSGRFAAHDLKAYGDSLKALFGWRRMQLQLLHALFSHSYVINRMVHLLNDNSAAKKLAQEIMENRADYISLLKPTVLVRLIGL